MILFYSSSVRNYLTPSVYHKSANKSALYTPFSNIFLKLTLTATTSFVVGHSVPSVVSLHRNTPIFSFPPAFFFLLSARPCRHYRTELNKSFIVCHCPTEGICCRIILRSGILHQIEKTVNSNLNFDMLIRTTFMIPLENF